MGHELQKYTLWNKLCLAFFQMFFLFFYKSGTLKGARSRQRRRLVSCVNKERSKSPAPLICAQKELKLPSVPLLGQRGGQRCVCLHGSPSQLPLGQRGQPCALTFTPEVSLRSPTYISPHALQLFVVGTGAAAAVQSGTVLLHSHPSSPSFQSILSPQDTGESRWTDGRCGMDSSTLPRRSTSGTPSSIRDWTERQPQETFTPARGHGCLDG